LPTKVNYFLGSDPSQWRAGVRTFSQVRYQSVYSGVDLVYYGNQRQLEYDFIVAPGADPKQIGLSFEGVDKTGFDPAGDLILDTGGERVRQHKPIVYQETNGSRKEIEGRYVYRERGRRTTAADNPVIGIEI